MNRLLLILDIDETLIHATEGTVNTSSDFEIPPYHFSKRPFLSEFLATVSQHYRIALWSSSSAKYVSAIASQIIPVTISLEFQWSHNHCVHSYNPDLQKMCTIKDLKKVKRLGYDLDRVLIVDDTPRKLVRNYGNAIYIQPFTGDPEDSELQKLSLYLTSLADCENVRKIEKRDWRHKHLD